MTEQTKRVARLSSIGAVLTEMGRIYREARRGEISTADAQRLCGILKEIRVGLELSEVEERISVLEREYERRKAA